MRHTLLAVGRRLERSSVRRFSPLWLKKTYWKVATSGQIHEVYGSRMYLPPDQRQRGLLLNRYEPMVTQRITEVLKPGMTFCDVGAMIGIFTLLAARLVGPKGRVIAFEPVPENAIIIRRNVALNGYSNVILYERAVAASPGIAKLYLSEFRGSHSILPNPARSTGRVLQVEAVRLDSLPEIGSVDLMKIDVEGAEIQVLESLGTRRPARLILEYNPEREIAAGFSLDAFLRVLRQIGYLTIVNLDAPSSTPVEASGGGNFYCSTSA